ncbi:redoxin domain-containing protein [Paraburkholderia sp. BCC1885]|uniref:redoxin domain-containing protein n=1 Tax=Paraburkholderia sp. BCC1885 TaxID=2562669 RepID=UPI0011840893|nr:redoxin domain-containing protein [Paraburkholderia sp. BCC1885]
MAALSKEGNAVPLPAERVADLPADPVAQMTMAASTPAASRALRAGMRAPLFTLADASGQQIALEDLLSEGPVVLHFCRGAWCSFGDEGFVELAAIHQDINALGANAVSIAPPCSVRTRDTPLPMRELQDHDMKTARAYGLAFELPATLRPRYESLGYVPPSTRKAGSWLVPLPATYLLDRDGIVVLAFIDVDYRRHFDPRSLLSALRVLQTRKIHAGRHDL